MSSSNARDINIHPHAFKKTKNLRLLNFHVKNVWENHGNKVHVPDGLIESNSIELKYLHWHGCPLKSLQRKFHLENLVILEMRNSNIEELWSDGMQTLHNLKRIDLRWSKHLISCPDLSVVPNLESLMLSRCTSLESIPDCTCLESLIGLSLVGCSKLKRLPQLPTNLGYIDLDCCESLVEIQSSFTRFHKVRSLKLGFCKSLMSIPDLRGLKSLTELRILYCSKLKMLPELPNTIEKLTLEDVPIEEFPPSWEDLDRLSSLSLINCSMLKSLPSSVRKWKSLDNFCMKNCSKIDKLPDDIGTLESLHLFRVEGTAIEEVPSCLKSLTYLKMYRCEGVGGVGLLLPPNLGLEKLHELILIDCGIATLPDSLGDLTSLQKLDLMRNNIESIPESIINLSKLIILNISYCEKLRELPQLPTGTYISAVNCTSLERLSYFAIQNEIFENLSNQYANFINCYNLDPEVLNDVVNDTRLKIQGQAALVKKDTLWEIYYRQVDGYTCGLLPFSIIYPIHPESKIPDWFENRSRGSSIDVELPRDWLNSNFLCFALCVVVAIPTPDRRCYHVDDHRYSKVTLDCNVKSKDGNESYLSCDPYIHLKMPYCGPYYLKSNHMITWFGYYLFREFCDNEFSFQFNVEDDNYSAHSEDDKEHFKVEMCGVHLMSGLHFETSYESEEEDESYLEESDEEDESYLEESDEEDE